MAVRLSFTEQGRGPPLIILHGLFGSKRNWASIAKVLSAHHHVICVDLRNHGESPWSDEMSYTDMAADVAEVLEHLDLGPCTVMGHSMGGKVAMTLALNDPHLCDKLVVVDIAPASTVNSLLPYIEAMQGVPLDQCKQRKDVEVHLQDVVTHPGIRQFLLQNLNREDGAFTWRLNLPALAAAMDSIAGFPDFSDIPSFSKPTLFIAGGLSDYIQAHHMGEIDRLFPGASVHTIENAGHWVHAEQTDAFLKEVQNFMGVAAT